MIRSSVIRIVSEKQVNSVQLKLEMISTMKKVENRIEDDGGSLSTSGGVGGENLAGAGFHLRV